jgi:hypothetical protein
MLQTRKYALLSDKELIDGLTAVPPDNRLHEYFFKEKCKHFLTYISNNLYNEDDGNMLIGDFYEYLSNDDWKILKTWEGKNGSSLNSYLASCSMNFFKRKVKADKKHSDIEILPSTPDIIEYLDHFTAEEESENQPVWEAFKMLKKRDQVILRLLVIEEKEIMEAANKIWPYIKTDKDILDVPQKHIQSIIAMAKHRALVALLNNLKRLTRN